MERNYGMTQQLKESRDVFTYFDILGTEGDGDYKYELYQKHLKLLNAQK